MIEEQTEAPRPRMLRPEQGRLLAGVCAALAPRLVVDVTLMRLAFLLLTLASGLGVVLYLVLWIVLPGQREEEVAKGGEVWANVSDMGHELANAGALLREAWRREGRSPWPRPLERRWLAMMLILAGLLVLLFSLGLFSWLGMARAIGLAAIVMGLGLLISLAPRRED